MCSNREWNAWEMTYGDFADARHGVEIRFAESADAHERENESEEDGEEGGGERYQGAEDCVNCGDAEEDRKNEQD